MKILLIHPPQDNAIQFLTPNIKSKDIGLYPPLGLLYIAAYVKNNSCHDIRVIDAMVDELTYSDIEKKVREYEPQIVGITTLTFTLPDVLETAGCIKKVNPEIMVCLGGPHVSIYPEESLLQDQVDFIVRGEGEFAFLKLADALNEHASYDHIEGIGYKVDGTVNINPRIPQYPPLDEIPFPDRTAVPYKKYWSLLAKKNSFTSMITSRGCPFGCTFCSEPGNTYRKRSPENVVREIEECLALGLDEFVFFDDTFTADKKRVLEICRLIIDRKLPIRIDVRTRIDTVDREILEHLKEAGCSTIRYGVESGTQEILRSIRKNVSLSQIKNIFKITKELHMTTFAYFMLSLPGETMDNIKETIRFSFELDPDYLQYSITTPLPDTEIYRLGIEKGLFKSDYWRSFARNPSKDFIPSIWDESFTRDQLLNIMNNAYRSFYFRAPYILKNLKHLRSFAELKKKITSGFNIFFKN